MNGRQQCVTCEDLAVIAIALQRRAPTLAYPILCGELDALIRTARPLADVDDAHGEHTICARDVAFLEKWSTLPKRF